MLKNTKLYGGVIYSQKVLLELVEKGYSREQAYKIVQGHALKALEGDNFKEDLLNDTNVTSKLTPNEIESCFDSANYLTNIDKIFARFE